jgi:hypothetical protein
MKRTPMLFALVLAAALGCAADGSAGKPAGGAHVRCRSVLETRPGPGGFGTQTVPVQKCEPVTPGPVGTAADLTKQPLDPAAVTEEPR